MKYALVTGASSGIGWHIATALAQKGYNIVAVSNQHSGLEDLMKNLEKQFPVSVLTVDMDLATPDAAMNLFNYCEQKQLHIEVLVNNAGILVYGETSKADFTLVYSMLQLQMTTPVLLCRLDRELIGLASDTHHKCPIPVRLV